MINTIKRWQTTTIRQKLDKSQAAMLVGARHVGKSTLVATLDEKPNHFFVLDDPELLAFAKGNPQTFADQFSQDNFTVIDEVQKAKEKNGDNPLLTTIIDKLATKQTTDKFLLTASTNSSLPTDATTINTVKLRPFTQAELENRAPDFFDRLRANALPTEVITPRREIFERALCGGYPDALSKPTAVDRRLWCLDHLDMLLKKDLPDVAEIKKVENVATLANVMCAWSGRLLNKNSLATTAKLDLITFDSYTRALSSLYLFDEVAAYPAPDYERISKSSKLFCTDSGLMSGVLNYQDNITFDMERASKLLETYVYNQFIAITEHLQDGEIFNYRDKDKREVDLIVRFSDIMIAANVRAAERVTLDDAKNILWLKKNMKPDRPLKGVIFYTGKTTLCLDKENDIWAVPISTI